MGLTTITADQTTLGGNKTAAGGVGTTYAFTTTAAVAPGARIIVAGG